MALAGATKPSPKRFRATDAPRKTPNYVAVYALHLAAANILFLAEAHKAMK